MNARIDRVSSEDLEDYLELCSRHVALDVAAARLLAQASLRYARGEADAAEPARAPLAALEAEWYASVTQGQPNYGVYDDPRFLSDLWSCWCVYSRAALRALLSKRTQLGGKSVLEDVGAVRSVADLGCGTGYSTAALADLFPDAEVVGTNLEGTGQYSIASEVADATGHDFRMVGSVAQLPKTDLVFASEYFEHFEYPLAHLNEVLEALDPSYMILANSFSAKAIGHFPAYRDETSVVPNKQMSRRFNSVLKAHGYVCVETGFWNGRPAYWKRK